MGVCLKVAEPAPLKPGDLCSHGECEELRCVNDVCAELAAIGESCVSDHDCSGDAWCAMSSTTSGVCTAVTVLKQGDACGAEGAECDGSWCKPVSATQRICSPYLPDGSACELTQSDACLYPARCELGVCALPRPDVCK